MRNNKPIFIFINLIFKKMKQKLTLLLLALVTSMGAWAQADYTLSLGTATSGGTSSTFKANFTYSNPGAWSSSTTSNISVSNPVPVTISTSGTCLSGWDCAIAAHNTSSFVISAPENYVITGYSFGVQTHAAGATCTVTPASGGGTSGDATNTSGSTAIVSETSISANSVTINISDVVTASSECKLYMNNLSVTLASDELIPNGGFEWTTGTRSWTLTGTADNKFWSGTGETHTGSYCTNAGNWSASPVATYTTTTTNTHDITLAAGKYELSFAYRAVFSTGGTITATLTNTSTSAVTTAASIGSLSDALNAGSWTVSCTQFDIASTGTYTFALNVETADGGVYSYHRFDDISLTKVSSTTPIASLGDIVANKVYTIIPHDATRGVLYSKDGYLDACGGTAPSVNNPGILVNASDKAQQFAFVTMDDKLYLYSVSEKKFANHPSGDYIPLTDATAPTHVTVEANGEEWLIKFKGTDCLNISTGWSHGAVANWNVIDEGNSFIIAAVDDVVFDDSEAEAILKNLFSPVSAGYYAITYIDNNNSSNLAYTTKTAGFAYGISKRSQGDVFHLEYASGDYVSNTYYIKNEEGKYLYATAEAISGVGGDNRNSANVLALSEGVPGTGDYTWVIDKYSDTETYTIKPSTKTTTAIGVWTFANEYYSFLELGYRWGRATFVPIETAITNYYTDNGIETKFANSVNGTAGYPTTGSAGYTNLSGLLGGDLSTYTCTEWSNLKTYYDNYLKESTINYPTVGKFYKFKSTNNRYIHSVTPDNIMQMNADGTSPDAIFYIPASGRFLSYTKGFAMFQRTIYNGYYSDGGYGTYTIDHYAGHTFGTVRIKYGSMFLFDYSSSTDIYDSSYGTDDNRSWTAEEVTSLPITMRAGADGAYYATINLPVAVTIPSGLSAYSATADGTVMTLTKVVEDGVLAANQPVILYSKSDFDELTIATTAGTTAGSNELEGTIAAESVTANQNYVLGEHADVVGFYKFGGTTMPGFKAYLPVGKTSNVKAFTFRFEDVEDAIRAIESENSGLEIYDIAGRRVQQAQKGLYIINGKKVLFK